MCSHVQTLSFFMVKNDLFDGKMLIFDYYLLLDIVPKFFMHLKMSQRLLRSHKFKVKKLIKIAAPTTVPTMFKP